MLQERILFFLPNTSAIWNSNAGRNFSIYYYFFLFLFLEQNNCDAERIIRIIIIIISVLYQINTVVVVVEEMIKFDSNSILGTDLCS